MGRCRLFFGEWYRWVCRLWVGWVGSCGTPRPWRRKPMGRRAPIGSLSVDRWGSNLAHSSAFCETERTGLLARGRAYLPRREGLDSVAALVFTGGDGHVQKARTPQPPRWRRWEDQLRCAWARARALAHLDSIYLSFSTSYISCEHRWLWA